jgi:esterase
VLYFKKVGEGKPLLILHGLFGSGDNWATLAKKYSEAGFCCYLIDQRNHGRSFHSFDFNYNRMSDDLLEVVETEKLEKVSVLGHSMGGKTAMFFTAYNESIVEKLIVADIAPKYYPPHHQAILAALNSIDLQRITNRKEAEEQLRLAINDEGTMQFLLKNLYWKNETELSWRFGLKELEKNIDAVGEALPALSIDTPTLFLKGERSGYIKEEDETEIRSIFKNVKIETVNDSGHWVHAENPARFLSLTLAFLTK